MTNLERNLRTAPEPTMRVVMAMIEGRLRVINFRGSVRFYEIPDRLVKNGELKTGVVAQLTLSGNLDYFEGEALVGRSRAIKIPDEDRALILSFVQDLVEESQG